MYHEDSARYNSTANQARMTTEEWPLDRVPAIVFDSAEPTLERIEEHARLSDEIVGSEGFETSCEMIANDNLVFYATECELAPGAIAVPEGYALVHSASYGADSHECALDGLAPTTVIEYRTRNVTASIVKRVVSSQYATLRLRVLGGPGTRGDVLRKDDRAAGVTSFIVALGLDAA
jgi:hypothetical protein